MAQRSRAEGAAGMTTPTLKVEGLELRPTRHADLGFVRAAEAAPENRDFVGQWSHEDHARCIASDDCAHFTLFAEGEAPPAGYVILQGLETPDRSLLLRRLVVTRKGQGVGGRALRAAQRFCFETLGFHRLWLDVHEDNPARHLYERLGFVLEGRLRENVKRGEAYLSTLRMSLLDREYRRRADSEGAGAESGS
ncbi:hypothetical protein AY600_13855 [Phormidium willei BDU 130791]|nr:hypothetical protein AY600_13855 [Phormidium willei BDU 130791]